MHVCRSSLPHIRHWNMNSSLSEARARAGHVLCRKLGWFTLFVLGNFSRNLEFELFVGF